MNFIKNVFEMINEFIVSHIETLNLNIVSLPPQTSIKTDYI